MGKLSDQEKQQFEALKRKQEAPDPEPVSRGVQFSVDLGKKDQVEMARKLGLIPSDDDEGDGDKGNDDDDKDGKRPPDKAPKRSAFWDT